MLEKYVIDVFDGIPKDLEGYSHLATEMVYVPFLKTDLSITKRITQGLSIIEEFTLKFIELGLNNIDDLCGVLGLDYEFVIITIADLYKKDYITHKSKICQITDKGKVVLRNLSETKNETDTMSGICLNLVTGEIEKDLKGLIKDCPLHKYKLTTRIEMNEYLVFIKAALPYLKEVFQEKAIESDSKSDDELVNIVNLSYDKIWFLPLKINIYISHDNQSLDILSLASSERTLVSKIKNIIIEDITKGKVLTDVIRKVASNRDGHPDKYSSIATSEVLLTLLRKLIKNRDELFDESCELENAIYTPRKMFRNEIIPLIRLLAEGIISATLRLSGDLKKRTSTPEIIRILQELCEHNLTIEYGSSRNIKNDISSLKKSVPNIDKVNFHSAERGIPEFALEINNRYVILRSTKMSNICNGLTAFQDEYYFLYSDSQRLD